MITGFDFCNILGYLVFKKECQEMLKTDLNSLNKKNMCCGGRWREVLQLGMGERFREGGFVPPTECACTR